MGLMVEKHPDVAAGSTNKYQNWEVVDPEKWVPDGYACVRVDSRGCGRTPGVMDHFSPRETKDFATCIEWAGVQPWSNGKVGLNGISYYGMNQWEVAGERPEHLAAMCVWEGASDWYRDSTHHGGILSTFWTNWYDMQVKTVQYGLGERGPVNPNTGVLVCGDETLGDEPSWRATGRSSGPRSSPTRSRTTTTASARRLGRHRAAAVRRQLGRPGAAPARQRRGLRARPDAGQVARDARHRALDALLHRLRRGHPEALLRPLPQGRGHRVAGPAPRPAAGPPRRRHLHRARREPWPLQGTRWTRLYLDLDNGTLDAEERPSGDAVKSFEALGDGLTFTTPPLETATELTGPSALKLWVSSSTTDADIFAIVRVFDPEGNEITFQGAIDPHTPVAQGWLRASHRKLDPERSEEYRPWHTHDEKQALQPGEPVSSTSRSSPRRSSSPPATASP